MFNRKIQTAAIATAVLCGLAVAIQAAAPNINYAASGVFTKPAVSGADLLQLAGQAFSISVVANEATRPVKHSKTTAQYANLPVTGTVNSGLLPGQPQPIPPGTVANLALAVGATGKTDQLTFSFNLNLVGLPLTFSSKISMPNGTITTPAIKPFLKTVTLAPSATQTMTYVCPTTQPACGPYAGKSSTLSFASGTLTATKQ